MTYGEEVRFLCIALRAQGFSIDDLTTEQFCETAKLIKEKGGDADLKDTAKIQAKFDKCREKERELELNKMKKD